MTANLAGTSSSWVMARCGKLSTLNFQLSTLISKCICQAPSSTSNCRVITHWRRQTYMLSDTHKRQFEERASRANFNSQQRLALACELGGASSGRVLDGAAGTSEITCALLKSGRCNHATVVDVSPEMLQSAKELLTSQ